MTQCAISFLNVRKIDCVEQKRERLIRKFIEMQIDWQVSSPYLLYLKAENYPPGSSEHLLRFSIHNDYFVISNIIEGVSAPEKTPYM